MKKETGMVRVIKAVIDRIGTDFHPLAKQAKDMESAAVFVSILITVMVPYSYIKFVI